MTIESMPVELHGSLSDPGLDAMNFLNEVVGRYPNAISFAPGRPWEGGFDVDEIARYLDVYCAYLAEHRGLSPDLIRSELFQYGRTNGRIHELVARTVENDEGIVIDPEAVVVTVGAQEGMLLVLRALFADPGDVLLVVSPCYVGITGAARLLDIDVVPVPEGPAGVDAALVARIVTELRAQGRRPRALYVMPDFANPSGSSLPLPARHDLLAVAARENLFLIEDNPYGFFRRSGTPLPTLKAIDTEHRVVYLGSFSKTCLPGARVGYVLADQRVTAADGTRILLADALSKVKSMTTVNTSAIAQAVVGGILLDNDLRLRQANAAATEFYSENLRLLLTELDRRMPAGAGISWNRPDGGFFVVLTVPFHTDEVALERAARDYGVLWTPMRYFHLDGLGAQGIRLSCSALPPERISAGIERLSAFVRSEIEGGSDER